MNKYLKSQNFQIGIQNIVLKVKKIYTKKLTILFSTKYFKNNQQK